MSKTLCFDNDNDNSTGDRLCTFTQTFATNANTHRRKTRTFVYRCIPLTAASNSQPPWALNNSISKGFTLKTNGFVKLFTSFPAFLVDCLFAYAREFSYNLKAYRRLTCVLCACYTLVVQLNAY